MFGIEIYDFSCILAYNIFMNKYFFKTKQCHLCSSEVDTILKIISVKMHQNIFINNTSSFNISSLIPKRY